MKLVREERFTQMKPTLDWFKIKYETSNIMYNNMIRLEYTPDKTIPMNDIHNDLKNGIDKYTISIRYIQPLCVIEDIINGCMYKEYGISYSKFYTIKDVVDLIRKDGCRNITNTNAYLIDNTDIHKFINNKGSVYAGTGKELIEKFVITLPKEKDGSCVSVYKGEIYVIGHQAAMITGLKTIRLKNIVNNNVIVNDFKVRTIENNGIVKYNKSDLLSAKNNQIMFINKSDFPSYYKLTIAKRAAINNLNSFIFGKVKNINYSKTIHKGEIADLLFTIELYHKPLLDRLEYYLGILKSTNLTHIPGNISGLLLGYNNVNYFLYMLKDLKWYGIEPVRRSGMDFNIEPEDIENDCSIKTTKLISIIKAKIIKEKAKQSL